jgi:hypothetical protein
LLLAGVTKKQSFGAALELAKGDSDDANGVKMLGIASIEMWDWPMIVCHFNLIDRQWATHPVPA